MAGLNKTMIIGHLGRDPEMRFTQDGSGVASFSVAVSEQWKDKSGNKQEFTEWFNVTAWGKLAEICKKYLTKGSKVYIEGKLKTREWEKDGEKRKATDLIAANMIMLSSKPNNPNYGTEEPEYDASEIPF